MTQMIEIVVAGPVGSGKSHVLELIEKALCAEYGHHVQIASHDLLCERGLGSPGSKPRVSDTIFSLKEQGEVSFRKLGERRVTAESQSTATSNELKAGVLSGRFIPDRNQIDAMRLVARLVNAGAIALVDDEYVPGQQTFRALKIGKKVSDSAEEAMTRIEATTAQLREVVAPAFEPGQTMIGSFSIDPLESAIESAARLLRDEREHLAHISTTLNGDIPLSPVYKRMSSHLEALLDAQLSRVRP